MTFSNIDAWFIVGLLVFGATVWQLLQPAPKPARIRKNPSRRN